MMLMMVVLLKSFNSRTPGGVRRGKSTNSTATSSFNSRTPGGVRPGVVPSELYGTEFQFTHPGRGATVWCKVAYYGADKQA